MIISGDLSPRSSGVTAIDLNGLLVDAILIHSKKEDLNDEDMILYNTETFLTFIDKLFCNGHKIAGFVFEGLAFGASYSQEYDKICGNFWSIKSQCRKYYPDIPIGTISPEEWRSRIITAKEKKQLKLDHGKIGIKLGVVDKLPVNVREFFDAHIKECGVKWDKKEKNPIFDLADSWGLAQYRLSLENKS